MIHRAEMRVRYHETDKMGVANHINHFKWFEVGRAELLREMKLPMPALEKAGCFLVLREARCIYSSPAFYDDLITVTTRIAEVRTRALRFEYKIARGDAKLADGYTVHVFTDGAGKVKEIPQKFKGKLEAAVED
jgi:acyl-CoA thioester hydrolase